MGKEFGVENETKAPLIWEVRSGNEWLNMAAELPEPKELLGECWLEGEMALMFGDTGKGKSLLAVQIAESIARGESIGPLANGTNAQSVLLVDVELSPKQFEMRYSDGTGGKHDFSSNFTRVGVGLPFGRPDLIGEFCNRIRQYLDASNAKVLIVDHVTAVRCSQYGTAAVAELVARLRQLRDEFGLSVLLLAQSPKRETNRPISINDLGALKYFGSMVDSIFAVGQSRTDAELRYIKQIKARSTAITYGEENVALMRLTKLDSRFLGFEFEQTATESEHLAKPSSAGTSKLVIKMQQMADNGWTQREIAEYFNTSKSRVGRLLLLAQTERDAPLARAPVYSGREKCIYEACTGCRICRGRPASRIAQVSPDDACGHRDCPDFCEICGPRVYTDNDEVEEEVRQAATKFFEDLREWLASGKPGERPEYVPPHSVTDEERKAHKKQLAVQTLEERRDTHNAMMQMGYGGCPVYLRVHSELFGETSDEAPGKAEPECAPVQVRYRGPDKDPDIVRSPDDPMAGLKRMLDNSGNELFIEEEFPSGKPRIWYRYNRQGKICRWFNDGMGGVYGDGKFDELPPIDAPKMRNGRLYKDLL